MFNNKQKENKEENDDEDIEYDDEKETDNKNEDELLKKYLDADGDYNEDEDLSYDDEEDEDDKPLTNYDKLNAILFVKNTLNGISSNSPEISQTIVSSLGENMNKLNDIFKKEEEKENKK